MFYDKLLRKNPEMKNLDFIEKVAKYFLYNPETKEVKAAYPRLNFIENKLNSKACENLAEQSFAKLRELKSYSGEGSEERIKILKELYKMFAEDMGKNAKEISSKLATLDMPTAGDLGGDAFKVYENVSSVSMLNLYQKRELLEKLLNNKSTLVDCQLGDMLNVKFLPKNKEEYCELVARLSNSIGLNVRKLSPEMKAEFIKTLDNMSKPDSEFMQIDFDNSVKRLRLDYSLDEFEKDIWYSIKDLSNVERGKVLDYFGFEMKNENGKLILNGFPNADCSEKSILKIKDEKLLNKIREIQGYVMEFTQDNNINLRAYPDAAQNITSIIKAFPEFLTSFGKLQSNGHDFSLDIHTLKVLQEIFKNPEYQKLPQKSKLHLQIAALFYDLTKAEGIVDKSHPQYSSFDAYYLMRKLELPEKEKLKVYQIIRNHTWLASYKDDTSKYRKQLAFELSHDDSFKLLSILTEADMKAVKKDGKFYIQHADELNNAKSEISNLVYDIQKTAINLPQTKIPKADKLNINSPFVSEINADGVKNVVVHLNKNTNLKYVGFDSNVTIDDLNILVHGLEDKNSASMFQALGNVDSDALLSTSYINYGKGNWKVFRKQGFVLGVSSPNIHAGYWRDFGSGYKKTKNDIIKDYLFSNVETRSYFSQELKNELKLNNQEYIDLYRKIEDLPIEKLDEKFPQVAKAYRNIFAKMDIAKRSYGRNYNEILVTRPKIQAIFCYDKSPENIPVYLRKFAQRHNLPVLVFE